MFGISWYEFLVILAVSFIALKPTDFVKVVRKIRYIINYINSLISETKDKLDKTLTLDEFNIKEFYVIDKKDSRKEISVKEELPSVSQEDTPQDIKHHNDKI
ncbi:MAG: twin-arginine translocase TatA/TatE family subunit [Alphaproteobacteria bacterium]|jgi:Sec-independent protein translocase protein TatA|nr:twin-arginine translocase TatA/TatE family subunit [Alphaproteobacteria bacterium]